MKRLRFLHIPKCAGITFTTMLRLQYLGKAHFSFSGEYAVDRQRFENLPPEKKARIHLFTGHAPIETGLPQADSDITIITLLRDPVSRVKSLCQHVSEGKSPHLLTRFSPDGFDLDDFLCSGNEGLSNLQTRMLINRGKAASSKLMDSMAEEEVKALALRNLDGRIACYGVQEYFEESLIHFQQQLGWRTPFYASKNRKNPRNLLAFEERQIERIAEMNAIDIEVYNAARSQFLERINSSAFDHGKLAKLRKLQPVVSPAIQTLIAIRGFAARARIA